MLPEVEMEDIAMDELRKAYRTAVFIGISMIVSLFLYASVIERIKPGHTFFEDLFRGSGLVILRYILYGMAVALFFVIKYVRNKILSTKSAKSRSIQMEKFFRFLPDFLLVKLLNRFFPGNESTPEMSRKGKASPQKVQKLLNAAIVSYAFCEAPALYGLVLFFIGKEKFDFYLLSAISIISFAIYFPRYHQWEEWMKTANGQV